jgi:serine O-acetyltransferase
LNLALHGCQIHPQAQFAPGLRLPHPSGVVVGRGVRAGRDVTLYQNVTLGAKSVPGEDYPILGNGVFVFPNSLILGSIRVGDGARVGACSLVLHEVRPGDTVAGRPAVPLSRPKNRPEPLGGQEAR